MAGSGDSELTMCDVLEEERELEEDAKAVLGDSDDTNCTYEHGYVPRQALYACATCTGSREPAGICLACSYACHENHDLVELYTKRNFRCDCGNSKFENNPCRLFPKKDNVNAKNCYNQNFGGLYCSCSRPYPDNSDDTVDEMIQCVLCEDWYHGRHLSHRVPDNEDYGEMICKKCIESHEFLNLYKTHFDSEKILCVDNIKTEEKGSASNLSDIQNTNNAVDSHIKSENNLGETNNAVDSHIKSENNLGEEKPIDSKLLNPTIDQKGIQEKQISCFLMKLKEKTVNPSGTAFLPEGWRKELCQCSLCIELYEENKCSFLLDEHDTIKAYEERGKNRNGDESQYDKGLSALSQLDRVQQIEAIHEYNNMKVQLKDYLKTFADAKRTVSAKDIQDFFEGMQRRKRQRVGNHVPHFCR